MSLGCDNQSARDLAYNPEHHDRVKHIARRHFFVRERVESGEITVPYVRSVDNLADFFTKALPAKQFFPMRDAIMNCSASEAKAKLAHGNVSTPRRVVRGGVAPSRTKFGVSALLRACYGRGAGRNVGARAWVDSSERAERYKKEYWRARDDDGR